MVASGNDAHFGCTRHQWHLNITFSDICWVYGNQWLLNTNQSTQSLQQKLLAATDQVVTALAAALIVSFHCTLHPSLGNLKVLEPESTTNKKLRRQGSIALWLGKSFEFICLWCDSYCHHKPLIILSHNSNTWQCTSLNIIRIQSIHMFADMN
jgi:hypothetical protein